MKQTINNYFNTNLKYPISAKIYGKCVKQDDDRISCLEKVKMKTIDWGYVDLGSLTWVEGLAQNNHTRWVSAGLLDIIKAPTDSSIVANMQCEKYKVISSLQTYKLENGISIRANNGYIEIYDSSKETLTAQEFKNSLQGIILKYQKNTEYKYQELSLPLYGIPDLSTKFINDKGFVDYHTWLVRDVWENCKQTKNVRVINLSQINDWTMLGNYFYSNALQDLIKIRDFPYFICDRYNRVDSASTDNESISVNEDGQIRIKDTAFSTLPKFLFYIQRTNLMLYYEANTPIETITSTLLVANEGSNELSFEDNNENAIDTDFELGYNELKNYKVGGKLVQYVNDRSVEKITRQNHIIYEKPQLPNGFHELESIESTGTQYIDTGIITKISNYVKLKILPISGDANDTLYFGSYERNNQKPSLGHYGSMYRSNVSPEWTLPIDYDNPYIFEKRENGNWYYNNDKVGSESQGNTNPTITSYLFARNYDVKQNSKIKCYYLIIKENSQNLLYFLPCKRTLDNEIGMLDLVSGKFFTNQGTGNFIAHEFGE